MPRIHLNPGEHCLYANSYCPRAFDYSQYAVKAQMSLALLSRFHGSRVTTAHAHKFCIYFRVMRRLCRREWNWLWNWLCVNLHPWQRTRDHSVWRLTLKGKIIQSRITIISKESIKISLQIGAKIMKIG